MQSMGSIAGKQETNRANMKQILEILPKQSPTSSRTTFITGQHLITHSRYHLHLRRKTTVLLKICRLIVSKQKVSYFILQRKNFLFLFFHDTFGTPYFSVSLTHSFSLCLSVLHTHTYTKILI